MKFDEIASGAAIEKTASALKKNNIEVTVVADRTGALNAVKAFIPAGASVMNGSSRTLEEIGYINYLKSGTHSWNNLHENIVKETDSVKKAELRKLALLSDYYLGSVHALAEGGEFLVASNTASQLPHVVYSSPNVIFVVGAQKIVPTLADGFKRLEEFVVPLEDARMKQAYGPSAGTRLSKLVVFKYESPFNARKVRLILVKEKLGF